ncbi:7785_t:CDS:2, partial [Racocetra persica]
MNTTIRSSLLTLPPETFLQICKSLSPADLLSLSTVCKTFYNDLCHSDSITIQEIWRQSRLEHIPCRELGPLEGMTERDYIRFLMEDKCGFCGVKNRVTRIYWERGVRAYGNKNWRYWFNQVQSKNTEFQLLSQQERDDWVKQQSLVFSQREQQLILRRQEDDKCREHVLIERRKAINSKLEEMCSLKNPDGSQ